MPFSKRSVGALAAALFLGGQELAAILLLYSFHIVGRGEQDWARVREDDVHLPIGINDPIGITLGRSKRGEKTKTGMDEGVLVSDPLLVAWLRTRVQQLRRRYPSGRA